MRVRDVMESVRDRLHPDDTLREAVNRMRSAPRREGMTGVKGMIVVDGTGRLTGMLSIRDILQAILPDYLEKTRLGEFTWDGMLEDMVRRHADRPVRDIMAVDVSTVREDAPLMECADLIVRKNLQRVPVLDADGTVVGIIYMRDLYYAIVRALMEKGGES